MTESLDKLKYDQELTDRDFGLLQAAISRDGSNTSPILIWDTLCGLQSEIRRLSEIVTEMLENIT